ncbi:MAG: PEP-CTERM sorting domain-containing protein [Planctomycetota bacterium]
MSTNAQTFDAALITESNTFNTDVFGSTTSLVSIATIEAGPQPNFVADYSTLGDTLLSVTWTAPAGQWIEIVPPTPGWSLEAIALEFSFGTVGIGPGSIAPIATVSAQDFTSTNGVPPTLSASSFLTGPGGDSLTVGVSLNSILPGEAYTFSSLTVDLTVPASYGIAFDNPILDYRIRGETEFRTSDPNPVLPADPGQWIRLVPEPGSLTLLALGGASLARRRRGSQR